MAKRRRETLDDLLTCHGVGLTAFAKAAGIPAFTLYRLREGLVERPRIATLTAIAAALGIDVERVRAACAASRAASS